MIKDTKSLSMIEAQEFVKKKDGSVVDLAGFIKKFAELNQKEAKNLRKEMRELNLIKINSKHISKMIDLMPDTKEDLNKIFTDVSLDENETNKILEKIKKFK